jgi:ubiquitin-conjugating enzyme E2 Q
MIRTVSTTAKSDSEHGSESQSQSQSQPQQQQQPERPKLNNGTTTVTSGFSTESSLPEADEGVIVAPPAAATATAVEVDEYPAEIPPETGEGGLSASAGASAGDGVPMVDSSGSIHNDEDSEEEDDYEYEEDDDAPFHSGFLVDNPTFAASRSTTLTEDDTAVASSTAPATIQDEDEEGDSTQNQQQQRSKKWREPTRDAVKMSLRAEKETTGGKRRLAQDLYRIMNQDTIEAGFSLEPSQEDSMDKWTIKLFKFDQDSNLAKDMLVLGLTSIELEMGFPEQYPFEPPFVRVVRPRFKRQTGFVMNGALCMELLTKDGWNPVNDIESVIVSVRSLLVVGDGRLEAAFNLAETKYNALLAAADTKTGGTNDDDGDDTAEDRLEADAAGDDAGTGNVANGVALKRQRKNSDGETGVAVQPGGPAAGDNARRNAGGAYSVSEAEAAYSHLSSYHKKKGWDTSGWWARKG